MGSFNRVYTVYVLLGIVRDIWGALDIFSSKKLKFCEIPHYRQLLAEIRGFDVHLRWDYVFGFLQVDVSEGGVYE